MLSWADPVSRIKALVYLSAAGVSDLAVADQQYVARLADLARYASAGRVLLLGFDYRYDADGNRDLEHSEFHTPNRYVYDLSEAHPDLFAPAISVHPHRADAVAALHAWPTAASDSSNGFPTRWASTPASHDMTTTTVR